MILLEKDLDVLADGVAEGRRIFANTIKYVLMGTSSNFGNMFSAAGASLFLPFLPMLPVQILLNNLLYDTSQLAIPTDRVDPEQLRAAGALGHRASSAGSCSSSARSARCSTSSPSPSCCGSSTPGPRCSATGWFVESLATQTLVIFAIRTRRVPFLRSRPQPAAAAGRAGDRRGRRRAPGHAAGRALGFTAAAGGFYLALVGMVVAYLVLIEFGKPRSTPGPKPMCRTDAGAGAATVTGCSDGRPGSACPRGWRPERSPPPARARVRTHSGASGPGPGKCRFDSRAPVTRRRWLVRRAGGRAPRGEPRDEPDRADARGTRRGLRSAVLAHASAGPGLDSSMFMAGPSEDGWSNR